VIHKYLLYNFLEDLWSMDCVLGPTDCECNVLSLCHNMTHGEVSKRCWICNSCSLCDSIST
jgi:hypothetical protein